MSNPAEAEYLAIVEPPAAMRRVVVTVRIAKNPNHDPRNKQTGKCPVSAHCTDVTGEHHSFLLYTVWTDEHIREMYAFTGHYRVTRIEAV